VPTKAGLCQGRPTCVCPCVNAPSRTTAVVLVFGDTAVTCRHVRTRNSAEHQSSEASLTAA